MSARPGIPCGSVDLRSAGADDMGALVVIVGDLVLGIRYRGLLRLLLVLGGTGRLAVLRVNNPAAIREKRGILFH